VVLTALLGSGSARAGSRDSAGNTASQNADFVGSGLLGTLATDQTADTLASANAAQDGTLGALSGNTSGEATQNNEKSWTSSNVTTGTMTFTANSKAGASTSADQTIFQSTGNKGSTEAGSTDGTHSTKVGSGFKNTGGVTLLTQSADTTVISATALQTGLVSSYGTTKGDAWTRSEAGDTTGRSVYVEEQAKSSTGILPVTLNLVTSGASADISANTNAQILRSAGTGTLKAYALSGGISDTASQNNILYTKGNAWAITGNRDASVSM
jgi:hypothetical protein